MRQSRFNMQESYRFGYQGQFSEEDDETGWNSFELRMYDAVIGRWTSMDPYRQFSSPYIGMGNNPVIYYDPNGGCVDANNKSIPCPEGIPEKGNEYTLIADEFKFEHQVSGFESFMDWLHDISHGSGGYEFFNTGGTHGEPLYWVRNGKAYGAFYDVSDNLFVFGKLGDQKRFPKGHMPPVQNWASKSKMNAEGFKDLLDGAELGGKVKGKVLDIIMKTSTAPHQRLESTSDTSYSEHYTPFGIIKRKSNKHTGEIYETDTLPNN
jgi:RHS repeat-associated protein